MTPRFTELMVMGVEEIFFRYMTDQKGELRIFEMRGRNRGTERKQALKLKPVVLDDVCHPALRVHIPLTFTSLCFFSLLSSGNHVETSRNNNESKLIRRRIPILLFYLFSAIPHAMTHFTLVTYFHDTMPDSLRHYNSIIIIII